MGVGPTRKGAGERRHRVDLQSAATVTDPIRGRQQVWTTYATEWGGIDATALVIDETKATVQYVVTLPYRPDWQSLRGRRCVVDGQLTLKILTVMVPNLLTRATVLHCGDVLQA